MEHQRSDGLNYAPQSLIAAEKVVRPGEFAFAAVGLDHGHIYGMVNGLVEAGAELVRVYDPDPAKVAAFLEKHPGIPVAESLGQVLGDSRVKMVAGAAVNSARADLGIEVLRAGKDYFCDKPLFTTLEQLAAARKAAAETGRRYMGYFSERLHVECAVKAGELVRGGAIGRVVQVIGLGPHRINIPSRPEWFFDKKRSGGILCDLGSHQIEQFLYFAGCSDARVVGSRVANYRYKQYVDFEDFGEMNLVGDNGAVGYFRLDWLTPGALEAWGDGRTFILGTHGYIELRKYVDVGGTGEQDILNLVNDETSVRQALRGRVGYPFFGQLILDCLHRTERAMTQEHAFTASRLAIEAEASAERVE